MTLQMTFVYALALAKLHPVPPPALVEFSAGFTNDMVLKAAPSSSAIYGSVRAPISQQLTVTVSVADGETGKLLYSVNAALSEDFRSINSTIFRAVLRAKDATAQPHTITASCEGCGDANATTAVAKLERVVWGEVFFCSGQSNMALGLSNTFSCDNLTRSVQGGQYSNIHFFRYGGMSVDASFHASTPQYVTSVGAGSTWYNVTYASKLPEPLDKKQRPILNAFHDFSATCLYFGIEYTELLQRRLGAGAEVPPIGLIQSAVGGSLIEAWIVSHIGICFLISISISLEMRIISPVAHHIPTNAEFQVMNKYTHTTLCLSHCLASQDNATLPQCLNVTDVGIAHNLFYGMVCPFINMSVSGWLWYQGENNMAHMPGNSKDRTGYGCEQPHLVDLWRRSWSTSSAGTDPLAPFGLVTIAPGGSEGHGSHMSPFRWSQTGNYGVMPNQIMPNTHVAQVLCDGLISCLFLFVVEIEWVYSCVLFLILESLASHHPMTGHSLLIIGVRISRRSIWGIRGPTPPPTTTTAHTSTQPHTNTTRHALLGTQVRGTLLSVH